MSGMSLEELEKFKRLQQIDYSLRLASIASESYSGFMGFVRSRLDQAIQQFEQSVNKMKFEFGEDALTLHLMALLQDRTLGFMAYHEVNQRGHCDITLTFGDYTWHAEAKKHTGGYAYLFKGYAQLTERYSTGTQNAASGGFIIYNNNQGCKQVMDKWKSHLVKSAPKIHFYKDVIVNNCTKNSLVLLSKHKHTVSGLDYEVTHYPINFYHNPADPDI